MDERSDLLGQDKGSRIAWAVSFPPCIFLPAPNMGTFTPLKVFLCFLAPGSHWWESISLLWWIFLFWMRQAVLLMSGFVFVFSTLNEASNGVSNIWKLSDPNSDKNHLSRDPLQRQLGNQLLCLHLSPLPMPAIPIRVVITPWEYASHFASYRKKDLGC